LNGNGLHHGEGAPLIAPISDDQAICAAFVVSSYDAYGGMIAAARNPSGGLAGGVIRRLNFTTAKSMFLLRSSGSRLAAGVVLASARRPRRNAPRSRGTGVENATKRTII
jgi:hypothetical protein